MSGAENGRKFIITYHIYPGAKYNSKAKANWDETYSNAYFDIIGQHHDKIVMEIGAHDHFSDIRYHSNKDAATYFYHNILISPGVTPRNKQNPGFATFDIDLSMTPTNLKMTFLDLDKTFGMESAPNDINAVPINVVDFSKEFGLKDISAAALSKFKDKLAADNSLTERFMVRKLGFDFNDADQKSEALDILQNDIGILTLSKEKTYKYVC